MLEVRALGAFEVKRDGKPVAISSRPAQGLFAYLVLTAGTSHRREKLAGLLWPDSTEDGRMARVIISVMHFGKFAKQLNPRQQKANQMHISWRMTST